jgi:hypothetical protein
MRPPAAWVMSMIDDGAGPTLHMMRRMGHTNIRTTYNLYGHPIPR